MVLKYIKSIWQSSYILQVRTRVMTSINTLGEQQQGWIHLLKDGIGIFFTSLVELIAILILLIILSVILFLILISGLGILLADQVMITIKRGQKK
jgi:hypothetical protein